MKEQDTKTILKDTLAQLEALSDKKVRARNTKNGVGDNQFGVKLGDIRKVAKKIKSNHELAIALWKTENIDARLLAMLIIKPNALSSNELDKMVKSLNYTQVADWINSYVVKHHPDKETLRQTWINSDNAMAARAGWNLSSIRVVKDSEGLDIPAILNRLESEMGTAPEVAQWTMNFTLAEIGINFPLHRPRAISIGEKWGIYRDYPVSKGCTSPFAPIWIEAMVSRQSNTKKG